MTICFELSMPNVGSWNGKWTGADRKHYHFVVIRKSEELKKLQELLNIKSRFHYDFEDGWGASIEVSLIKGPEVQKRRKNNAGFSGYEWMCTQILKVGKIITRKERIDIESRYSHLLENLGIVARDNKIIELYLAEHKNG